MNKPTVVMEFDRACCLQHGEVFRAGWPSGYPSFVLLGVDRLMKSEFFAEECGGKIENANSKLDEKPLCCRLAPDELEQLYNDADAKIKYAKLESCQGCGCIGYGVPYRTANRAFDHLCFHCIVHRLKPEPTDDAQDVRSE